MRCFLSLTDISIPEWFPSYLCDSYSYPCLLKYMPCVKRRHDFHAGCFEFGSENVLLIIAEIKLYRIGAVSVCHWVTSFLKMGKKNCCKMFGFYNSLFRVWFNFGCNYPRQIVAKMVGKCGGFRLCHDTGSACYSWLVKGF